MKNRITAQSCTEIIASGASTVLVSHWISVTPRNAPASQVMIPFGCNSIRHTTATTTTGGRTGRKNSVLNTGRPGNTWLNSTAANSDRTQTGNVAPATKTTVFQNAVTNRSSS